LIHKSTQEKRGCVKALKPTEHKLLNDYISIL